MQLIRNFQNINSDFQNTVLTIGNFDGVHLGHQEILKNTQEIATDKNLKSALLTFEPHPLKIINPSKYCNTRLQSSAQKLRFLQKNNLVDIVFINQFNQKLKNLSAQDFVKEILVGKLKIKHLVIGHDFIFGKDRLGDANLLQKSAGIYNFSFHQIAAKSDFQSQIFSSTKIRNFITKGDIEAANLMLGQNYQINGIVIEGKKMARNFGFPTANFLPKKDLIRPKFGVYKANILIEEKKFPAILNFGIKPTFEGTKPIFEAHIFNFNQQIYGKKITAELLNFIREEKKFDSVEELKKQIEKDIKIFMN